MDHVRGTGRLAGEGLINLKQDALIPVPNGLQVKFHSSFFLEGAHHVQRELERDGKLNEKKLDAFDALEGSAPAHTVPLVAAEAFPSLRHSCRLPLASFHVANEHPRHQRHSPIHRQIPTLLAVFRSYFCVGHSDRYVVYPYIARPHCPKNPFISLNTLQKWRLNRIP
jgi:hypothetical protein